MNTLPRMIFVSATMALGTGYLPNRKCVKLTDVLLWGIPFLLRFLCVSSLPEKLFVGSLGMSSFYEFIVERTLSCRTWYNNWNFWPILWVVLVWATIPHTRATTITNLYYYFVGVHLVGETETVCAPVHVPVEARGHLTDVLLNCFPPLKSFILI